MMKNLRNEKKIDADQKVDGLGDGKLMIFLRHPRHQGWICFRMCCAYLPGVSDYAVF